MQRLQQTLRHWMQRLCHGGIHSGNLDILGAEHIQRGGRDGVDSDR